MIKDANEIAKCYSGDKVRYIGNNQTFTVTLSQSAKDYYLITENLNNRLTRSYPIPKDIIDNYNNDSDKFKLSVENYINYTNAREFMNCLEKIDGICSTMNDILKKLHKPFTNEIKDMISRILKDMKHKDIITDIGDYYEL